MSKRTTGDRPPAHGRGWAAAAFGLGVLVSVAANVAHAWYPSDAALERASVTAAEWSPAPGAMIMSAFYPIALLLTVEILSRVEWPRSFGWAAMRFAGAGTVALVAATVSYGHMHGLLIAYGENELTASIGPLAVDGLMVVSGFALLAIGRASSLAEVRDVPEVPEPVLVGYVSRTRRALRWVFRWAFRRPAPAAEIPAVPVPAEIAAPVPDPPNVLLTEEVPASAPAVPVLNGTPAPYLEKAKTLFAEEIAAGKVPTIGELKNRLHVGQPKATRAQQYLGTLTPNRGT